ncbi:hypothetical protein Q8W71_17810 [Methylobacterium sp. NEAU 140]|uniref:Eco57I restriction-modification methylase domain-containing protein n=1 Tax=Methylobacterium sp. NEAU 140 TaxID=3064945 RepID=UPI0027350149|nr:hypothetical protein [Methylobacterium sp. NEAU 140]MDP4024484.1 hypothetical protein [Methylobacterium sp. NEAU 140]
MIPYGGVAEAGAISQDWRGEDLSLYLGRCQVDTPDDLVALTWREVAARREAIGKVVDFGAGDGRFARGGNYSAYVGYEIDWRRCGDGAPSKRATIVHRCAFSEQINDADVCIGNPPFVRNQDLPAGWRKKVAERLEARSGVRLSGLANAWQYFFLLSLVSLAPDGLCALVIPYEWVSRPSAAGIRRFILAARWDVDVYRVADSTFGGVLTTSSITLVDKRSRNGRWRYFSDNGAGDFRALRSESGSDEGLIPFEPASGSDSARAMRGLSPGTQRIFTLTEPERARMGLLIGEDVVPCVTSLRLLPEATSDLDQDAFYRFFRASGQACWLIRSDASPSDRVLAYLSTFSKDDYATSTCLGRPVWWKFKMPATPSLLVATSFKGFRPKVCANSAGAKAVGGVAGIFGLDPDRRHRFMTMMAERDLSDRVVAHAKGLRKIEINQLNALLAST